MKGTHSPIFLGDRKKLWHRGVFVIVLAVIVGGIALTPQPADANFHFVWEMAKCFASLGDCIVDSILNAGSRIVSAILSITIWFINSIVYIGVLLSVWFLKFATSFALSVSYTPLGENVNQGVVVGWILMRNLANMWLVLVLIAIGVGTMLNLSFRGGRFGPRLLVPFFASALLINFSPLITGAIIDIGNILTKFFFDAALYGGDSFLQQNPLNIEALETTDNLKEVLIIVAKGIIQLFVNIIAIFVLLITAFMVLMRVLALWLLVIFSPMAFALAILPQTRHYFNSWMHSFLQWTMITIPIGFFLWLSSQFLVNGQKMCGALNKTDKLPELLGSGEVIEIAQSAMSGELMCNLMMYIFGLIILFLGMTVSLKSSAVGSSVIISRAQKAQKWARRESGKYARREVKEKVTGPAARGVARGLQAAPGARRRWLGIPQRWAARGLGAYEGGVKKERGTRYRKEMDNLSYDQKRHEALYGDPTRRAAAQASMNRDDPKRFAEDIAGSEKLQENFNALKVFAGTDKEIKKFVEEVYKTNPQLATDKEKAAREYANPRMMTAQAWADQNIVQELIKQDKINRGVLETIAKDEEKMVSLFESIVGIQKKLQPDISGKEALTQFFRELRGGATKKAFAPENVHLAAFLQAMSGNKGQRPSDIADTIVNNVEGASDEARDAMRTRIETRLTDLRRRRKDGDDISSEYDTLANELAADFIDNIEGVEEDMRDNIQESIRERMEDIKTHIEEEDTGDGKDGGGREPTPAEPKKGGPGDGGGAGGVAKKTPAEQVEQGVYLRELMIPKKQPPEAEAETKAPERSKRLEKEYSKMEQGQKISGFDDMLTRQYLKERGVSEVEVKNMTPEEALREAYGGPAPKEKRDKWLERTYGKMEEGRGISSLDNTLVRQYLKDERAVSETYIKTLTPEEALRRAYGPPPHTPRFSPPTTPSVSTPTPARRRAKEEVRRGYDLREGARTSSPPQTQKRPMPPRPTTPLPGYVAPETFQQRAEATEQRAQAEVRQFEEETQRQVKAIEEETAEEVKSVERSLAPGVPAPKPIPPTKRTAPSPIPPTKTPPLSSIERQYVPGPGERLISPSDVRLREPLRNAIHQNATRDEDLSTPTLTATKGWLQHKPSHLSKSIRAGDDIATELYKSGEGLRTSLHDNFNNGDDTVTLYRAKEVGEEKEKTALAPAHAYTTNPVEAGLFGDEKIIERRIPIEDIVASIGEKEKTQVLVVNRKKISPQANTKLSNPPSEEK